MLEYQVKEPRQPLGNSRHGNGDHQVQKVPQTVGGKRVAKADEQLLAALASVVEASGRFSFGVLTGSLSVTEQLDFGYKLIAVAGRVRTRAEVTRCNHSLRVTNGERP